MQAYKLKGTIDASGNLILDEPLNIAPGEVEVIILQVVETPTNSTFPETEIPTEKLRRRTKIKAFQDLFDKTQPAPPDFDPDEARWEALKEKYNL